MLLITPRTRRSSIALAAAEGTPLPLRLSRTLSATDLLRIFEDHRQELYGEELTEILLSSAKANSALVEAALKHFRSSLGVLNAAALSNGANSMRLAKLARSKHRSVRQHAKLSLLADSLTRAPARDFVEAVERARRSRDRTEQLYIIVTHRHAPRSVLLMLAKIGPDLVRDEATRRLRFARAAARMRRRSRTRDRTVVQT